MVNPVGNTKALMVVLPSNEIVITRDSADRHPVIEKRDKIVLENKTAFKSYPGEKGTFIDLYA